MPIPKIIGGSKGGGGGRGVHVRPVEVYTIAKTVLRYSDVRTRGGGLLSKFFFWGGDAIKVAN